LLVACGKDLAVLYAFNCLGAQIVRRQETQISENLASWNVDFHLAQPVSATDAVVHSIGRIALAKHNVALAESDARHKRLQPVNRRFSIGRRGFHIVNEFSHLLEPNGVQGKQNKVQYERGINSSEKSINNE